MTQKSLKKPFRKIKRVMVGQLIILYRNFTFNATKYAIKCSEVTPACFIVYKVTDLLVVGNISGYKKKHEQTE